MGCDADPQPGSGRPFSPDTTPTPYGGLGLTSNDTSATPSRRTGDGAGATAPGLGIVALDQMSDAAAHAVLFFSQTKVDVRNTPN